MAVIGFGTLVIDVCLFLFNFAVVFYLFNVFFPAQFNQISRRFLINNTPLLLKHRNILCQKSKRAKQGK
jgi:hypothetical protein